MLALTTLLSNLSDSISHIFSFNAVAHLFLRFQQTPIQNLEKGCARRISLCSTATSSSGNVVNGGIGPGAPGAAGDARPESGLRIVEHAEAVFGIEKETVDSGRIKLSFRTVDETGFFPIRSCCILEAELIITKRYRNIDTQKSLFSILRDGGK